MESSRSDLLRLILVAAVTALVVSVGTVQWVSTSTASTSNTPQLPATGEEVLTLAERDQEIVSVIERAEPAVVSVMISKDVPIIEHSLERVPFGDPFSGGLEFRIPQLRQLGTERRDVGGGTAFFVRSNGLLLTNKHVVNDPDAEYTVFLNDGRQLKATVVALDPSNDIALLKVDGKDFPALDLLPSEPHLGQTAIAIGNALAEFRNTVSVGVISGPERSIVAGGGLQGETEHLNRILQTDAAINQGSSGGPLIGISGHVIGMNTAVAGGGAQNIAFAIPSDDLYRAVDSYEKHGRILRAYLGVRYSVITPELKETQKLSQDHGVIAVSGVDASEPAILPNSPASKAGLKEGDIILEIDGIKLTPDSSLQSLIQQKAPGDRVELRIAQNGSEKTVTVTLEEMPQR